MDYEEQTGLDERVVSALHDVAMTGRARRLRYEHAEGLSLQQAQRDLRDLASAGILEPVGRSRARYYREGPRFPPTALTEARTPIAIHSPRLNGAFDDQVRATAFRIPRCVGVRAHRLVEECRQGISPSQAVQA
jgi:hypothetical protein